MKKLLLLLMSVIVTVLLVYSFRETILLTMLKSGIERQFSADLAASLDDGLHIALCGAGGPLPSASASGPCVAIVAGNQTFIVDSGTDGVRNLLRMQYQVGDIQAVFLTHFHSDHIDGLGELATLRWAGGANIKPLPVYGPPGVEKVVAGFNKAYSFDFQYRQDHHGDTVAPLSGAGMKAISFEQPSSGQLVKVYQANGLTVEALLVDHHPVDHAVGYLFSYKERRILISGDTAKSANLEKFAAGVDILVHDALAPNLVKILNDAGRAIGNPILERIAADIPDYHASPLEAAEIARTANVGHLLYYHIVPPILLPGQEELFLNGADEIFDAYTIGKDGVSFFLPAHSEKIVKMNDGL